MKVITAILITALFSVTLLFTSCITTQAPYMKADPGKIVTEEKKPDIKDVVPGPQKDIKLGVLEQRVEELNKEFGSYHKRDLSAHRVGSSIVSIEKLYYYGKNETIYVVIVNGKIVSVDTINVEKIQK